MIHEIATISVAAGHEEAFEAGVRSARPLFEAAPGFCSLALERSIEHPERYRLVVGWETVEHHTVDFRNSPAFAKWRELVGQHFASAPEVEHVAAIDVT